jgi:hypothetical protein
MFASRSAALLAALFLVACSPQTDTDKGKKPLAFNDFENVDGWLADSPYLLTLSREKAHSGTYSSRVDGNHEFSLGYNNALSRLSPDWPPKLTVGAWVFVPNEQASAQLVIEIKQPGKDGKGLLWQGLDLAKTVKLYNQWQYVEQTITLPDTAGPQSRLLAYVWRGQSTQPVFMDDLQVTLGK